MKNYFLLQVEIRNNELQAIFKELQEAQETIYRCYNRLQDLGVLVVKDSESDD